MRDSMRQCVRSYASFLVCDFEGEGCFLPFLKGVPAGGGIYWNKILRLEESPPPLEKEE